MRDSPALPYALGSKSSAIQALLQIFPISVSAWDPNEKSRFLDGVLFLDQAWVDIHGSSPYVH